MDRPLIVDWKSQLIVVAACLYSSSAWATVSSTPSSAGAAFWIAIAIAHFSRRRAIGGPLLFYFVQTYISFFASLFFLPQIVRNITPSNWETSREYVTFLLGVVPVFVAHAAMLVAGVILLVARNENNLRRLKVTLLAFTATSFVGLAIDLATTADVGNIAMDFWTLFFAVVWTIYFFRARRVQSVFVDHDWHYTVVETQAASPAEKRYVRTRALAFAVVSFIVGLVVMGVAFGDEKPGSALFGVPILFSIAGGAIGWLGSISKKKRAELVDRESNASTPT